jgi:hypothetical protein
MLPDNITSERNTFQLVNIIQLIYFKTSILPRYNRKGTLSAIPKTGGCLIKGPKIPHQVR